MSSARAIHLEFCSYPRCIVHHLFSHPPVSRYDSPHIFNFVPFRARRPPPQTKNACENRYKIVDDLVFTFRDVTVRHDDTPAGLGMSVDENIIRVVSSIVPNEAEVPRRDATTTTTTTTTEEDEIVRACVDGRAHDVVDLLSRDNSMSCSQSLRWRDNDGLELFTPPIFICIDYGHAECVANLLLLHDGNVLDGFRGGDGNYTALQWASWTVRLLVSMNCVFSEKGCCRFYFSFPSSSNHFLVWRPSKGNLEIVKILVEEGRAKVDDEALYLAREYDHVEVVQYLLDHMNPYSGLEGDVDAVMERACREGDLNMVRELLNVEGYDIERWVDRDTGMCLAPSPLHLAVRNCHVDLIQFFAEMGVRVE